jgi:hypothetical protein
MDSDGSSSSLCTCSSDFSPKPVRKGTRAKSKADRRLRERERVYELGKTYKTLRNLLTTPTSSYSDKKINKIPIIEAAIRYIEGLQLEKAQCMRSKMCPPCHVPQVEVKPHPSQLVYANPGGHQSHYNRQSGPLPQCAGWRDRQKWNL